MDTMKSNEVKIGFFGNYFRLTSIMMKNESMESPKRKSRRALIAILGIIAVFCIFIPACILVGAIAFIMTTAVKEAGGSFEGVSFILMFVSGFSIVFGLSVILNVFYFSNDTNYLLPLPLQPGQIIASKFTVAYINESIMEFMVILSALIGFMLAYKVDISNILVSLFAMVTVPVIPLVYCGIVSIILMTFTGVIKNKDSVHKIMGFSTVILIVVAFASVSAVGGLDVDNYAKSLANGSNSLYNILLVLFVHVELICRAMGGDIFALLMYVVINLVAIAVFLLLAQKLYFKGVVGLGATGEGRNIEIDTVIKKKIKVHSARMGYFKKEMLMLLRTPAFLMNCVLINLLWPVLLYAVYMLQGTGNLFRELLRSYRAGNDKMLVYVPVFVIITSILVTAANSLASGAVTREGAGFEFMKYIPLPVKNQLLIKAMVSIFITQGFLGTYIIGVSLLLKISLWDCIFYLFVSLCGVVFVTFLGILLDTVNPKLLWDDEINALRGNSTIFFCMAYAMILGVILVGIAYVLLEGTKLDVAVINGIIVVFMLILDVVAFVNCMNMGQSNIEDE